MAEHKPTAGSHGERGQTDPGHTDAGRATPVTLATVVESLGPDSVEVWAAPHGLEVPVSDIAVRERDDERPHNADLLLAIGTVAAGGPGAPGGTGVDGRRDLAELLAAAASDGARAVLVRNRGGPPPGAAALADGHGVALLGLSAELEWAEVIGRLRALLALAATPRHGHVGVLSRQHDLSSLANTLAGLVHGSVMIFTPGQELLAASRLTEGDDDMRRAAVLEQHGPPGYRSKLAQMGVYHRLWSDEGVVEVDAVPELGAGRRLAVAVRAGKENLGSIWVAESGGPLAGNAASLLAESAPVVAVRLLGLDQEELARHRMSEELVGRLLLGEVDPRTAGAHLGIPPDAPAAVIVAEFADPAAGGGGISAPAGGPAVAHRVREESLRHLAGYRWRAVATTGPDRVLIALVDAADPEGIARAASGMAASVAESVGVELLVGMGPSVPHIGELPASHTEAELVVRALKRRGQRGVRCASYDDVRGTANLIVLSETVAADERLQAGPVARLRAHDRRRGTDYTATLAVYLDAFGDTATAARALNVHANTLRYRLGRVRELTGLDLADPHERLSAGIQLFALGVQHD
ncbi:PucR family transcriptional regulator [Streptomyces bathyalis]|uniref:PucR family transcriptional regulator n=1 Tax=Streptomyces bathyalis TaxID=2710756 RepID=A0A7T1TC42_9ACTN|nr:helix-turn-helix domain-containing protein [Streptomyces bathyalis]QPP10231.1 PucR family transcriptional regulator [Streptomyces bathyalis]